VQVNIVCTWVQDPTSEPHAPRYIGEVRLKSLKKDYPEYLILKTPVSYEDEIEAEKAAYKYFAERLHHNLVGLPW